MTDSLKNARLLANELRYKHDLRSKTTSKHDALAIARDHFYQNGLCIAAQVTPDLNTSINKVCNRLNLPCEVVEAFIYPSPEIQAACVSDGVSACLRFSSTLVETLSCHEFEFVAGHELGHFLLEHGEYVDAQDDSLEYFMQLRACEISADRIGLVACDSLDVAIRAMMKTVSGLTSRHLRFDVTTFLDQLKKQPSKGSLYASHPSILVRCRALLWFSASDYIEGNKWSSENYSNELDDRIEKDFQNYVDVNVKKMIDSLKQDFLMWVCTREIIKDGNFSKAEQSKFSDMFGSKNLNSMKKYLQSIPSEKIKNSVDEKIRYTKQKLIKEIPNAATVAIKHIEELVEEQIMQ